jgi:hypothetical protein
MLLCLRSVVVGRHRLALTSTNKGKVTLRLGVTNSTRADISPPGQGMYSFVFYACIHVSGPLVSAWESNHVIWRDLMSTVLVAATSYQHLSA